MAPRDEIIRSFPKLSPATAFLLKSLAQEPGLREVAEAVAQDPSLSARVLQTANSSRYARTREITDIVQAAVTLGRDTIRRIALSSGLRRNLACGRAQGVLEPLWSHSVATALIAQGLGNTIGPNGGDAYTAGLLHDVGAMALAVWKPDVYNEFPAAATAQGFDAGTWERDTLGVDRWEAGGWLAEEWALPERLREAIRYPDVVTETRSTANIVRTGSELAELYGYGLCPAPEGSDVDSVLSACGLSQFGDAVLPEEDLKEAIAWF